MPKGSGWVWPSLEKWNWERETSTRQLGPSPHLPRLCRWPQVLQPCPLRPRSFGDGRERVCWEGSSSPAGCGHGSWKWWDGEKSTRILRGPTKTEGSCRQRGAVTVRTRLNAARVPKRYLHPWGHELGSVPRHHAPGPLRPAAPPLGSTARTPRGSDTCHQRGQVSRTWPGDPSWAPTVCSILTLGRASGKLTVLHKPWKFAVGRWL